MATLTADAAEALRQQLAHRKRRNDIEILDVLGVRPEWVQEWFGSCPGLVFDVAFTYTSGRRQRRTDRVGFTVLANERDHDHVIPPPLLRFLSDAVLTTNREAT